MNWLLQIMGYYPYRHLAGARVTAWLLVVCALSATIASVEALFFALTTWKFSGDARVAVLVGVTWFFLTYSLDRVISLSDTSRSKARWSTIAGFLARCAAICLLFVVSVPQVRYLAVEPEVEQYLLERRAQAREAFFNSVEAKRAQQGETLSRTIAALERELTTEVAGKGLSGRRGKGATALSIEAQLVERRAELAKHDRRASQELETLRAEPDSTLAQEHGVRFPGGGYAERRRIAEKLLAENAAYGDTANLAKYLVAALFLLLLGAKVLEGSEVRTYLSARWQMLYASYLRGAFNEYLAQRDHPPAGRMSAERFVGWVSANPRVVSVLDNPANGAAPADEAELCRRLNNDAAQVESEIQRCAEQLRRVLLAEASALHRLNEFEQASAQARCTLRRARDRERLLRLGQLHAEAAPSERQSLRLSINQEVRTLEHQLRGLEPRQVLASRKLARVRHDQGLLEHRLAALEAQRAAIFAVTSCLRARKCEVHMQLAELCALRVPEPTPATEERTLQ